MSDDLSFLTLAEASRLVAARKLSPVELAEACLARTEAVDGALCSFITPTPDLARQQARQAEADIMRSGPRSAMHGIPYSLKDIYETAGIRTTGQSRTLADNVPSTDCHIHCRLVEAGGVLMGKATTWEFAHGGPAWDVVAPPARNPWDISRTPAGSSSGSAVGVAAGLVLGSMGSDTGGSIRQPAAACGIAGIKPTYGRLSRRGILPNCFTHDHAGPLAWTSEDLAILMNATAGYDPLDPGSVDLPVPDFRASLNGDAKGLVIGVPWKWIDEEFPVSPASRKALADALEVLAGLGATVRHIDLPPILAFNDSKRVIAMSELFSIHEPMLRTRPDLFGRSLRYRIMCGALLRAEDYVQATRMRARLASAVQAALHDADVIVLPCAEPAGKLEAASPESMFDDPSYTVPFNVSGNPALSVCNGFSESGMPFSMQIAGRLFDEATVLRVGDAYEKATAWRQRRPHLADLARQSTQAQAA
ncbi:amidase [Achromobacter aloeverae]|uniref:Asp-tRNA(Asn)/Glu-tRNA(Gln) amidotransferase GatCAB subunit A n=1 Tax=Achromobacter aloeverae TaxID=1750518 RepID=A0A4Q1HHR7_9BURK|nr:amidase [Achromobacter aloeverae]RXN86977.1 Asp-tRNA(Asn)/Glu-tRNA(Gln) amidotransferase GatCAB subunit A [Achromobacter aloeverae]